MADATSPFRADLTGRVILITGGSRGIGAAVAQEAALCGATVAIGYRTSRAAADEVVESIRDQGGSADAFPGDVSDELQARSVVAEVERRMGPIDGLVNAAAVMATRAFLEIDAAEWERLLRSNVYSVVFVCQAVIPGMLERRSGSIVNFSSRLSEAGAADAAHYAATKAAVVSLTRSLAMAYGQNGVRVNAVSPGTTGTDMGRDVIASAEGRARAERIPIRRFVTPSEVAAAVIFLLSDAAAGFAGQTLYVNGGELMR